MFCSDYMFHRDTTVQQHLMQEYDANVVMGFSPRHAGYHGSDIKPQDRHAAVRLTIRQSAISLARVRPCVVSMKSMDPKKSGA